MFKKLAQVGLLLLGPQVAFEGLWKDCMLGKKEKKICFAELCGREKGRMRHGPVLRRDMIKLEWYWEIE